MPSSVLRLVISAKISATNSSNATPLRWLLLRPLIETVALADSVADDYHVCWTLRPMHTDLLANGAVRVVDADPDSCLVQGIIHSSSVLLVFLGDGNDLDLNRR